MKKYIVGMSTPRAKILEILSSYSDVFEEHIIRCVVFGNTTGNFNHWIEELSTYLTIANKYKSKPSNSKLKTRDYENTLFAASGTDISDGYAQLYVFRLKYKNQYPEFEVTEELAYNVAEANAYVLETFLPILTTNNDLDIHKIFDILSDLFKEYK